MIEGSRIAAVGPNLTAADAEAIGASSMIVMPGFIDPHRHIWEGILRNIAADAPLDADLVRIEKLAYESRDYVVEKAGFRLPEI